MGSLVLVAFRIFCRPILKRCCGKLLAMQSGKSEPLLKRTDLSKNNGDAVITGLRHLYRSRFMDWTYIPDDEKVELLRAGRHRALSTETESDGDMRAINVSTKSGISNS